jgi:Fe-S cluster assembly protein SufD
MTVAITRTKAEQALTENFEAVVAKLPGSGTIVEARKAAIGAFAAMGLPHRRLESWKYTDLRSTLKEALPAALPAGDGAPSRAQIEAALEALAEIDAHRIVFVDGAYDAGLSGMSGAGGVTLEPLSAALTGPDAGNGLLRTETPGQEAVVALNTAFMTDGAMLTIADDADLAKPLLLVFVRAGRQAHLVTTRNIVSIGRHARATLIEAHVTLPEAAAGQANALTQITVGAGAHVAHVKLTLAGDAQSHVATWIPLLGEGSIYRAFQFTAGTGLVRNNVLLTFKGENAKADISGCFLGRATQHIDTTLVIDHAVPACESRELFKGALAGRARGVFQGKVIVRPDAQKTDGKQMAQVLMLSEDAEFDSKPELEINADDVVCGHGSTAADIDEDLLFYFNARGIPPAEARALLIESFLGEAIDKIEDEALRSALMAVVRSHLPTLAA